MSGLADNSRRNLTDDEYRKRYGCFGCKHLEDESFYDDFDQWNCGRSHFAGRMAIAADNTMGLIDLGQTCQDYER